MRRGKWNDDKNKDSAEHFIYSNSRRSRVLTPEEEVELFRRIRAGDKKAVDTVVINNQKLVMRSAFKIGEGLLDYADLIQEGNFGLLRAIRNFKPEFGYKFSTYAVWVIEQFMERALKAKGYLVKPSSTVAAKLVRVQKAWSRYVTDNNECPTPAQLAEMCDLSEDEVKMCKLLLMEHTSLDQSMSESENQLALVDVIPAEGLYPDEITEREVDKDQVAKWLDILPLRDAEFIKLRFGFGDLESKTRIQLAMHYGISETAVQRWEKRVLDALRKVMRFKYMSVVLIFTEREPGWYEGDDWEILIDLHQQGWVVDQAQRNGTQVRVSRLRTPCQPLNTEYFGVPNDNVKPKRKRQSPAPAYAGSVGGVYDFCPLTALA